MLLAKSNENGSYKYNVVCELLLLAYFSLVLKFSLYVALESMCFEQNIALIYNKHNILRKKVKPK